MREHFRDDETPTTEDVKARWMHASRTDTYAQGEAQFERWLGERDANKWDEALKAVAWALDQNPGPLQAISYAQRNNPYRGGTHHE